MEVPSLPMSKDLKESSYDVGHNHRYAGTIEPAPSEVHHTHRYFTFASINDRNRHQIRGVTGLAIPLSGESLIE